MEKSNVKQAKIVTITSSKGGVGKTVFTTNLAGIFSMLEKKVLLIDLDLYTGGIKTMLNIKDGKTIYNLVNDITNNLFNDRKDYIYQYNNYIDIMTSCKEPQQGGKINEKYVGKIIDIYKGQYDVILFDTTHLPLPVNVAAMTYSDTVLYMMSNDPVDMYNSLKNLTVYRKGLGEKIKLVLNNSFDLNKKYFSNFDIKNYVHHNIDYILNESLYIPNIDKYVMDDAEILILNHKLTFKNKKDLDILKKLAKDLCGGEENAE